MAYPLMRPYARWQKRSKLFHGEPVLFGTALTIASSISESSRPVAHGPLLLHSSGTLSSPWWRLVPAWPLPSTDCHLVGRSRRAGRCSGRRLPAAAERIARPEVGARVRRMDQVRDFVRVMSVQVSSSNTTRRPTSGPGGCAPPSATLASRSARGTQPLNRGDVGRRK